MRKRGGGNPFGPTMSVASDGPLARGCPILSSRGLIEVYETFQVM